MTQSSLPLNFLSRLSIYAFLFVVPTEMWCHFALSRMSFRRWDIALESHLTKSTVMSSCRRKLSSSHLLATQGSSVNGCRSHRLGSCYTSAIASFSNIHVVPVIQGSDWRFSLGRSQASHHASKENCNGESHYQIMLASRDTAGPR